MEQDCCKESCDSGKPNYSAIYGCDMTGMMVALADSAWEEMMKEKMKAILEKKIGEKMSRVADVSVKASLDYWENEMAGKAKVHAAREGLGKAFMY